MEPPQPPKGPYGTQHKGRRPSAKAKCAPMTETVRNGARGATMRQELTRRPTQINGVRHARDIARERQQAHRRSVQDYHQEGAREGMSERLRQGLPKRNKREKK